MFLDVRKLGLVQELSTTINIRKGQLAQANSTNLSIFSSLSLHDLPELLSLTIPCRQGIDFPPHNFGEFGLSLLRFVGSLANEGGEEVGKGDDKGVVGSR